MNGDNCSFSPSKMITCLPWPWIFYALSLAGTAYFMSIGDSFWEAYIRALVFFNGGIQCLWAAIGHLIFPVQTAQKIGWQPNGFQTEIGFVNVAFSVTGILSLFNLMFLGPLALMLAIFYSGCIYAHIRDRMRTGRKPSLGCYNLILVVVSIVSALIVLMR